MIRMAIDGVAFQLGSLGVTRIWCSILKLLALQEEMKIYVLDRGNTPAIEGLEYIPFPTYSNSYSAADSIEIQKTCDQYDIQVFTSTWYTSPINTPMVLIVYDMISELLLFNRSHRAAMEKSIAISYAQRYLCISQVTRQDLMSIYPEIPAEQVALAHCGVDDTIFHVCDADEVAAFRNKYQLERPYVLLVGSLGHNNEHKNSRLLLDSLGPLYEHQLDMLCTGSDQNVSSLMLSKLPATTRCQRLMLSDDELALAYGGALALVYPSLYEGFGLPVIEAMACGCPVITTRYGALAETAGTAALLIDGTSPAELQLALSRVKDSDTRRLMRQRGLRHARQFRWEAMADELLQSVHHLLSEARRGFYNNFFLEWRRLRRIQANVDY